MSVRRAMVLLPCFALFMGTVTAHAAQTRLSRDASGSAGGTSATAESKDEKPWYWYDLMDREGFLAVGSIAGPGSMRGFRVGYGIRVDSDEVLGRAAFWYSRMTDGDVHETAFNLDFVPWFMTWDAWAWGGSGPILGVGINHRDTGPDEGHGRFLTLGWEVAVWSPKRWQVMLGYEHDFGISSPSSNSLCLSLAYANKKLTIGSVEPKE